MSAHMSDLTVLDEEEVISLALEAGLGDSFTGYQEASVEVGSRSEGQEPVAHFVSRPLLRIPSRRVTTWTISCR